MVYDNTKLIKAMKNWLKKHCKKGFGEEYAGDLLASFLDHCQATGDMKRSPGRVVFGQQLAALGFERRKLAGLTYWSGLKLRKAPKKSKPLEYKKTGAARKVRAAAEKTTSEMAAKEAERRRKQRIAKVKEKMRRETADRSRAVGGAD